MKQFAAARDAVGSEEPIAAGGRQDFGIGTTKDESDLNGNSS